MTKLQKNSVWKEKKENKLQFKGHPRKNPKNSSVAKTYSLGSNHDDTVVQKMKSKDQATLVAFYIFKKE